MNTFLEAVSTLQKPFWKTTETSEKMAAAREILLLEQAS